VLAAPGLPDPLDGLLRESLPVEHARVSRAERYREQVAVYTAVNGERSSFSAEASRADGR
jgi:hypothetical protein